MNLSNETTCLYFYCVDMPGDRGRTDDLLSDGRTIQIGLQGKFR